MNKDIILALLKMGKTGLLDTFNAVPDDKLNWKPLDNGRSALDLFADAAQTTELLQKVVTSRGEFKLSVEVFQKMRAERPSISKSDALAMLETNYEALVAAVASMSEEELAVPITMPVRGGMTHPLVGWAMGCYRAYIARFAQINYIQTLYGDFDPH